MTGCFIASAQGRTAEAEPDSALLSNKALLDLLNAPAEEATQEDGILEEYTPQTPAQTLPVEIQAPAMGTSTASMQTVEKASSRNKRPAEPEWWSDPAKLQADTTIDVSYMALPIWMKIPAVFGTYSVTLPMEAYSPMTSESPLDAPEATRWASQATSRDSRYRLFMQQWMLENPELVRYNAATMERPPRQFVMTVDPSTAKITVEEFDSSVKSLKEAGQVEANLDRINWLHTFDGSVQFSQAYLSPNWYQGGNSNLNAIANIFYNVKLNPAFHPNLIFETTVSYKLGANNAPDDSVHQYNISDDLLQINSKFGVRAARRWFYSVNVQFKTQLLNNYKKNSDELAAAFMSPGELNIGLGMTYAYQNPKKTLDFNASIAPGSYNLKTCTNRRIDPTQFGIDAGKTYVNQYGSSAELTLKWKMAYNIEYFSRLFLFTNYEYMQGDWENTITFNISRFLTTRVYAHLRYDSGAQPVENSRWHHWQLKEILSIGFAYKFQRG